MDKPLLERASEEFNIEDDEGRTKLVYAYFGLAIYYCQCLEETFGIMLWTNRVFKKKVKTNEELNKIIDAIENSTKTMGNLLNEIKQNYGLPEDAKYKLESILNKRNYLTHKYFKMEIQKFYSDVGRFEMIKYCCDVIDQIKPMIVELEKFYENYRMRLGLTEERIEMIKNQMLVAERERAEKIINELGSN